MIPIDRKLPHPTEGELDQFPRDLNQRLFAGSAPPAMHACTLEPVSDRGLEELRTLVERHAGSSTRLFRSEHVPLVIAHMRHPSEAAGPPKSHKNQQIAFANGKAARLL
jgi:hypothetical protein